MKQNLINTTNLYIIYSMSVKHTEYQQIFQTTVTDHRNVHAVYPASIFFMARQNGLS